MKPLVLRKVAAHINYASDMPFDRSRAEKQVNLIVRVSIPSEIFNYTKATLAVGNCGIQVVLFAVFINRKPLSQPL